MNSSTEKEEQRTRVLLFGTQEGRVSFSRALSKSRLPVEVIDVQNHYLHVYSGANIRALTSGYVRLFIVWVLDYYALNYKRVLQFLACLAKQGITTSDAVIYVDCICGTTSEMIAKKLNHLKCEYGLEKVEAELVSVLENKLPSSLLLHTAYQDVDSQITKFIENSLRIVEEKKKKQQQVEVEQETHFLNLKIRRCHPESQLSILYSENQMSEYEEPCCSAYYQEYSSFSIYPMVELRRFNLYTQRPNFQVLENGQPIYSSHIF
jgi:hypothetical protein